MAYSLENRLIIGISTRALFDLRTENRIFEEEGVEAYAKYQREHETEILKPGPGFSLIKALLSLNTPTGMGGTPEKGGCAKEQESGTGRHVSGNRVEVVLMSKNSPDISLRIFRSIEHYGLDITRSFFTSGAPMAPYLAAFRTDLFLSACEEDVRAAIEAGIAAGIVCGEGNHYKESPSDGKIRIAFDADAVIFSDEAENVFRKEGLEAFENSEKKKADIPLCAGPFARFLHTISDWQQEYAPGESPIRTALVTARSAPAHERVIRTLRAWNVRIDEACFLGGVTKRDVLAAFGAQIFFDDQQVHVGSAAEVVPSARVPAAADKIYSMERVIHEVS
ncbi:MAG: 5'-nucleotidase [Clostridium sp.]|nr:5'-nucleotidase [Clostridium sp.]